MRVLPRILNPQSRITVLVAVFVALSTVYSIVIPPFEASDELWHYPMVKYIAEHWALPVQDPENVGPWRQEGSQPPLYYFIGAVATFWIDTANVDVVRHLNPHADKGIATADGNINLITHHPDAESFPWRGTALAVHLVRFLSVLMGGITVYLTYRLSLELLPGRRNLALAAAAVNAFTPMFTFISGAINNDNLVVSLCSLALLLMVRIAKAANGVARVRSAWRTEQPGAHVESRVPGRWSLFASLGIVVGLALLTKESAGGLVFLTALTVIYVAWRDSARWRTFLTGAAATGAPALLIAGWWYVRNWRLYGDPLGQNVFIEVLGQRDVPADLNQLWRERVSFMRGYWGNFGGLNVLMPDWAYTALDVLLILAALGLVLYSLSRIWALIQSRHGQGSVHWRPRGLAPWFLALLWPVSVVVLWITWATTTWSSQGRLVFSAISVWSLLLVSGWYGWTRLLPQNLGRLLFASVPLFMFTLSLSAPFVWIRPAYTRPRAMTDAQIAAIPHRVDATFFHPSGGQIKLLGYDAPIQAVYPGQTVPVTLYWEAIEAFQQDYSIFLHLVDVHDLVPAQRDAFPGMGTLSTRWLTPGAHWAERRVLSLPESAFSPNQTVFEVGLYDRNSGERLVAVDAEGQIAGDHVRFGQVEIPAHAGDWPNPIAIDLGGELELVGYDLDRRATRPGETTMLTLYWRGQRKMETNYSISTQFVDKNGVKAAQKDAWPLDGAAPTSLWEAGALIEEPREMVIFDGTPPGVYDVYLAVYPSHDPKALVVVTPSGGRLQTDRIVLTTIRVLP